MAFESNLDYESSRDPTRSKRNLTAVRSLGLSAAVNLQCATIVGGVGLPFSLAALHGVGKRFIASGGQQGRAVRQGRGQGGQPGSLTLTEHSSPAKCAGQLPVHPHSMGWPWPARRLTVSKHLCIQGCPQVTLFWIRGLLFGSKI